MRKYALLGQHAWEHLLCKWMNVCLPGFAEAQIRVWSSSCSLYHRHTGASFERKEGEESGKNDFSIFSEGDLLCSEVNCIPGERRSVSWACSRTAQKCLLGFHLEIHQMEASPETELCPRSVRLVDLLWVFLCLMKAVGVSSEIEVNHLSAKHTQ